ncbi:MAG: ATP-binding cassette domain-containing protein [Spirochaetaceae bacterium]|nr:MAG: ATP-binding cassette domain-containing protein [Spirochaetaceae bacterium]
MIIELQNLSFTSGGETFLQDISCRIEEGSVVLVMGPGGSGKTLLLKLMAGIVPATGGEILVDGEPLSRMSDRQILKTNLRQGFVFQDAALWQNLSLRQNLSLPVQYHFPSRSVQEINSSIDLLVRKLGFRANLELRPAHLSGGNRTTVSIMRALMLDPELCFMDEPSNGLDGATHDNLLELLKELKSGGRTLVIASHDGEIASLLADWILVLDEGRLLAFDTVQNLKHTEDERVRAILREVLDLSTTYDTDILEILGESDENPFA